MFTTINSKTKWHVTFVVQNIQRASASPKLIINLCLLCMKGMTPYNLILIWTVVFRNLTAVPNFYKFFLLSSVKLYLRPKVMAHRVFVYGTLKQGQPNHHVITGCKEGKYTLLGQGRTVSKWPLVIASPFNIPYLLDIEGEGHVSIGITKGTIINIYLPRGMRA